MIIRKIALLGAVAALALTAACSTNPPRSDPYSGAPGVVSSATQYGYVSGIEIVTLPAQSSGGGAVLGAVLGAVVGNQIGGGSGRAAATGLGAVGGAVIGSNIESRNRAANEAYRISVRLDNGQYAQFDYRSIGDLRIGDRIRVENGQLYRD